jgi:hypothetical protein
MSRLATVLWLALLSVPAAAQVTGLPECEDGIDNDGDGLIDFPADPGCLSPTGTSEVNSPLDFGVDLGFELPDFSGVFAVDLAGLDLSTPVVPPGESTALVATPGAGSAVRPQTHGCGIDGARGSASAVALVLFALAAGLWWRARRSA